jgi:hypothetical protein
MTNTENQIPTEGPLSVLTEGAWTGVSDNLRYGGQPHLRKCYRIPIDLLHFNIENGRYHTKFLLLKKANPDVIIDATQERWKQEIFKLLSGAWEDPNTGINTKKDRPYFLNLGEDIKDRGQERPGIVLETGGVMSGNRRLAALLALYAEQQNERFRYFDAFIVPSTGNITNADLWHLEMAAQQAQARLTREYEPVERLLKIRQGIESFEALNPPEGEGSAIRAVANDFGVTEDYIVQEMDTLKQIESYLDAIGHPEEWWLAEGLTEVFTEIGPLLQACDTNTMPFEDRSKLIRAIYRITQAGQADYRLIRDVRASVGPLTRRRGTRRMPSVTKILVDNAPTTAMLRQGGVSSTTGVDAEELVDRFHSEFEANKDQEAPVTKAERAESNLRKLVDMLRQSGGGNPARKDQLVDSLRKSRSLTSEALGIIGDKD